jgi:flagellar biosynthesis/type III secretory pathway protein FliH
MRAKDVIRFAFAIGKKVVHRIVATDAAVVIDQVAAALAMVSHATSIEIAIHPEDRPLVEAFFHS